MLLSEEEGAWIRSHWPLAGRLLAALRTEPNLELAVLFGSVARGDDVVGVSDVDLLVGLRHPYPGAIEVLRERLGKRMGPTVQLVPLHAARRDPQLLAEILRDGRPLVDRSRLWPSLQAQAGPTRARAEELESELREGAGGAVGYFQRLASVRAQSSIATG
jgi:predicted nucleotidyltransferase